MSGLRNLFGSSPAAPDNNDALKFVAPKAKDVKQAAAAAAAPVPAPAPVKAAASASVSAPTLVSKPMASATVRLYRMNPSTNAYEPIAQAGPLGCVAMGFGSVFQILVYNAQKAPQAVIQITNNFEYSLRDQYMSCKDSGGNGWSLLFDNIDQMRIFLRVVMACVAQVCSRNSATTREIVVGLLPGSASASNDAAVSGAEVTLAAGMSAGVHFTAWELGDPEDTSSTVPEFCYPADMLASSKYPPFMKVLAPQDVAKVKIGSADAAGEEPIGGLGEAVSGYKKGDKMMVAMSPKKVFSGPASERMIDLRQRAEAWVVVEMEVVRVKSQEKKKKEEPVAAASVDQGETSGRGRTESDLAVRMAKLAAKSGGGGGVNPMAGAVPNASHDQNQTPQNNGGNNQDQNQNQNQNQNQSNGGYNQNQNQNNGGYNQNNVGYNQHQNNGGYNQHQNNGSYNQNQNNGGYNQNQNQNNGGYNQQQPSYPARPVDSNPYAVTLVSGQESRSAYMPQNQGQTQGQFQQNPQNQGQTQGQFQQNPYGQPANPQQQQQQQVVGGAVSVDQALMGIQASVTLLHTKMDRLGGSGVGGGLMMTPTSKGGAGLQVKATELVSVAQSLLTEYEEQISAVEKRTKELDSHASSSTSSMLELKQQYERDFKEEREKLRKERDDKEAKCEKLEEKLEAMQAKNEKMMADKTAMLEKQQEQFEKNADQNSRFFTLQQEVDGLRRAAVAADSSAESSNSDKLTISDLQIKNQELLEKLAVVQDSADAAQDKLNSQMSSYEEKVSQLQQQLSAKQDELAVVASAASEPVSTPAPLSLDEMLQLDSVSAHIKGVVEQLQGGHREELQRTKVQADEAMAAAVAAAAASASASATASGSSDGAVSNEKIKELVSDVYTKMVEVLNHRSSVMEEESGEPARFEQKDVVKITRSVLKQVSQNHSS